MKTKTRGSSKDLTPTVKIHPFPDVEIHFFGRNQGRTNWSIKAMSLPCDSPYASINNATPASVKTLYAPSPDFRGDICYHAGVTKHIQGQIETSAGEMCSPVMGVDVRCGVSADGILMPEGKKGKESGYWLSSADCLLIVVRTPKGDLLCAHAGGLSLYDLRRALTGRASRRYESVVDAISVHLGSVLQDSEIFIGGGICALHFKHPWDSPLYGEHNEKVTEYLIKRWGRQCVWESRHKGFWSLKDIAVTQFIQHRVLPSQIAADVMCTYHDTDDKGAPLWWSHERSVENQDGKELCRNGVLVFRT